MTVSNSDINEKYCLDESREYLHRHRVHLLHVVETGDYDLTGLDERTGLFLSRYHDRHSATEWHGSDEYRGGAWRLRLSSISPECAAVLWLVVVLGMGRHLVDTVARQPMERIGLNWVQMCAS